MNVFERDGERGIPWTLVDDLRCPCCGSGFEIGAEVQNPGEGLSDGVLQCDCYEYPVVSGIAVLRQMSPASSTENVAVNRLKRNDPQGALLWLLENGSATGVPSLKELRTQATQGGRIFHKTCNFLRRKTFPRSEEPIPLRDGLKVALRASRPRGYADYFYLRFANPSFLAAIPPLVIFNDLCRQKTSGRILDLMCGVEHAGAIISALGSGVKVVAADSDFVNLFIARKLVAPQVVPLCVDAELPLPFADSSIDGFFCLDGLHYIRSKVALLQELDRIITTDGTWLFAHMHNAKGANENPGAPLLAEGYARRFTFGRQRLMAETEVIRQFQKDGSLDLRQQPPMESLASSSAFTLMGARTESWWREYANLDDALCRRPDLLGFNPLYQVEEGLEGKILRSVWPSESLRRECMGETQVLPESVRVPSHIVDEINQAKANGSLSEDVRKLLRSFVLVSLPECYPRPGLTPRTTLGSRA